MKSKKAQLRKPSEVYKPCPACRSKRLIPLEVDVICGDCDWMSCEEYVECGGMDNLFAAFRDHFGADAECDGAEQAAVTEVTAQINPLTLVDSPQEELLDVEVSA